MTTILKMQSLKKLKKGNNIRRYSSNWLKKNEFPLYFIHRRCCLFFICLIACIASITGKAYSQGAVLRQENFNSAHFSKTNADTLQAKSPAGAALRSLLIPGLGQFYNEKRFKGLCVVACEGVLLYLIYNENKKIGDLESDDPILSDYRERRSTLGWWFFSAVGLSVVDAYVDAYLDKFNADMDISVSGYYKGFNGLSVRFGF